MDYIARRNYETCSGKVKYPTSKKARQEKRRIFEGLSHWGRKEPERLHEYRCVHCGQWHLGHPLSTRDTRKKLGSLVPPKRKKFHLSDIDM